MRLWIVQKDETVHAIFEAFKNCACSTEDQVEAIAAAHGDTVTWAIGWDLVWMSPNEE